MLTVQKLPWWYDHTDTTTWATPTQQRALCLLSSYKPALKINRFMLITGTMEEVKPNILNKRQFKRGA